MSGSGRESNGHVENFVPDRDRLIRLGFGRVAHVPALFDRGGLYLRFHNRYLRERATGDWTPNADGLGETDDITDAGTLRKMGYQLINFNKWCVTRKIDWREIGYDGVLAYQEEMIDGRWSKKKRRLKPSTANGRADQATHFLLWAADNGLRAPIVVPMRQTIRTVKSRRSGRSTKIVVSSRSGRSKLRRSASTKAITMLPTADEIKTWLSSLKPISHAKALACRMIIETGPRLFEVCALRVEDIPTQDMLDHLGTRGHASVPVELTKTKGGRPRELQVPLPLASDLRAWIDGPRLTLAHRFRKRTGKECSDALFVSDAPGYEGLALQRHTIQRAFKLGTRPPVWHPHLGRHTFVCFFILHALELEAAATGRSMAAQGSAWLQARGQFWLDSLRRQLGHLSEETTALYLRWLATAASIAELANGWHYFLNSDDEISGELS